MQSHAAPSTTSSLVRFASKEDIVIPPSSASEVLRSKKSRKAIWYQKNELDEITRMVNDQLQKLHYLSLYSSYWNHSADNYQNDEFCYRGLERRLNNDRIQKSDVAVKYILATQAKLKRKQHLNDDESSLRLARVSSLTTKYATDIAIKTARQDASDASTILTSSDFSVSLLTNTSCSNSVGQLNSSNTTLATNFSEKLLRGDLVEIKTNTNEYCAPPKEIDCSRNQNQMKQICSSSNSSTTSNSRNHSNTSEARGFCQKGKTCLFRVIKGWLYDESSNGSTSEHSLFCERGFQ